MVDVGLDPPPAQVGERIVAEGAEDKTNIMATSVQLPAPAAVTAKK